MGGDIVEQGEVGSPGSDGASPYLRRRLPASIRRSTILAKHRLEAYATLTSSRGGCWLVAPRQAIWKHRSTLQKPVQYTENSLFFAWIFSGRPLRNIALHSARLLV